MTIPTPQALAARRDIGKWLNEGITAPIDRVSLAELCAGFDALTGAQSVKAAKQAVQAVPGWQWVPVEPTPEMLCSIEKQWLVGSYVDMTRREYAAMLAAAPQPPAKQSQSRLTETQAQEIIDSVSTFSGSYELAIVRATEAALGHSAAAIGQQDKGE